MEKASGVYLTITDNSFIAQAGTQVMKVIIPMKTTKGNLGFNYVTANTFKDIVGYDLEYNSNYYGLEQILQYVSYAQVWRLNQGSTIANCFTLDGSTVETRPDVENVQDVASLEGLKFAVMNKSTGYWQDSYVRIEPLHGEVIQQNQNATTDKKQIIELSDINSTRVIQFAGESILDGLIFYDSFNSSVVGVVRQVNESYKIYKIFDGNSFGEEVGVVRFTGNNAEIELTSPVSNDSFWSIHTLPTAIKDLTLTLSKKEGNDYLIQNTYNFSIDSQSEIYINNVNFGDLYVKLGTGASINDILTPFSNWQGLQNGSNGSAIIPANVDLSILDNCGYNIMAMNGLTDYKLVNKIATKIKKNKIHLFADAPDYSNYIDLENWKKLVTQSEYLAIGARPDTIQLSEDEPPIYLYPSVNYVYILSQMLSNYGSLNFPPAGPTYGIISTEKLIDCDYDLYANELKTNRINWQRTNNVGTMMWEQRTTYALNTDLSYIAPVFIVDQVAEDIVTFEQQFNFRYMTPTDILNQSSGLNSILQDYVDRGFLYSYKVNMPTYEEAQKAGRTLEIPIEIVIMKDSEVIEINLILNNAQ